jgi:hypothetical protein
MSRVFIAPRVRREFREYFVGMPLGRIQDYFEAEGLEEDGWATPRVNGERRSLVERYYAAIDWTSWRDCERVLRVYEAVLDQMSAREAMTDDGDECLAMRLGREHLLALLARDGITTDQHGALRPTWEPFGSDVLETLPSESAVLRDLDRMRQSIETEPDAAIGAAKDAVESVLKHALHELGVPYTEKGGISELADLLQRELGLHPGALAPAKGADQTRKILGAMLTQVKALAELRNLYGVGHGRLRRSPLQPRHARLAAKAADAYVTFILDTLGDKKAPWRAPPSDRPTAT